MYDIMYIKSDAQQLLHLKHFSPSVAITESVFRALPFQLQAAHCVVGALRNNNQNDTQK
jgi:hypothetical protein